MCTAERIPNTRCHFPSCILESTRLGIPYMIRIQDGTCKIVNGSGNLFQYLYPHTKQAWWELYFQHSQGQTWVHRLYSHVEIKAPGGNISIGDIHSIEICIGQSNTQTFPGYNASICWDPGFSCFMAIQYPYRFPSDIHLHIIDNVSRDRMLSNTYILRMFQYIKYNAYVHHLLFDCLAPEIISICFV